MPSRWRTQATRLQSIAVEVCWCPFDGAVAGDFSDLVDLMDGRVVAVLGDAPGFGPPAAEVADKVRFALRRALRVTDSPDEVLRRLDAMVADEHPEAIVTAVCAVIDPVAQMVEVSSAGHLPILMRTASDVSYLDRGGDPPLGVRSERTTQCYRLERDATLVFFTDGLVERRGRSLDHGLQALADIGRDVVPAAAWASELARRATGRLGDPTDDATVLTVRLADAAAAAEAARGHLRHAGPGREPTAAGVAAAGGREPACLHAPVALRLYVDRRDLRSTATEAVVRALADRLTGQLQVDVEVVDLRQAGAQAEIDGVLAAPTVLRLAPEPVVRVIGGLRNPADLARALQLPFPDGPS